MDVIKSSMTTTGSDDDFHYFPVSLKCVKPVCEYLLLSIMKLTDVH